MGCTETALGTLLTTVCALLAGLGMLLVPDAILRLGDRYLAFVERLMVSAVSREPIERMRVGWQRRRREVRLLGVFFLLLALPLALGLERLWSYFGPELLRGC